MNTSNLKNKAFIPLIILTITSFGYAIRKKSDVTRLTTELKGMVNEKQLTQKKLAQISSNYENATHKNKKLSRRVISEINKIITLKDSVNELDSDLKTDKQALTQKKHLVQNLASENRALSEEISVAKALSVDRLGVTSMRKKINGKFTRTTNIKKIDAFKVSFKIQENKLATNGQKEVYVQIIDPYNNTLGLKEKTQINNKTITYSDVITIDYNKESLNVVSLVQLERGSLEAGEYIINTYIDGVFATSNSFTVN